MEGVHCFCTHMVQLHFQGSDDAASQGRPLEVAPNRSKGVGAVQGLGVDCGSLPGERRGRGGEQLPMQALRRCHMQRPTYLAGRVMERLMPLVEAVTVACVSAPCACMAWRMLLFSLFRGCVMYMASVLLLCRPISSASMQQRLMPSLKITPA